MSAHAQNACKHLARRLWNRTWKKWALGAGGGATTWKVVEQLVAIHVTDPQQRAVAWSGLAVAIFALTAASKYGDQLQKAADDAIEQASETVEQASGSEK